MSGLDFSIVLRAGLYRRRVVDKANRSTTVSHFEIRAYVALPSTDSQVRSRKRRRGHRTHALLDRGCRNSISCVGGLCWRCSCFVFRRLPNSVSAYAPPEKAPSQESDACRLEYFSSHSVNDHRNLTVPLGGGCPTMCILGFLGVQLALSRRNCSQHCIDSVLERHAF